MVEACLNGATSRSDHPAVPLTPDELARDAHACVAAGAGALHFHPRDAAGLETLDAGACAAALAAVREAVPGVPLGLSSAIDLAGGDAERRLALIRVWTLLPDFVSVNLSEPGADELARTLLDQHAVGVEAGVTVEDAEALAAASFRDEPLRVLVEVHDSDGADAVARAAAIERALDEVRVAAPRLHHGDGPATWAVIRAALERGRDIRVGFEDVLELPDGRRAQSNAELVAAAIELARAS